MDNRRFTRLCLALCGLAIFLPDLRGATNELLAFRSGWSFFDGGSLPASNWFTVSYIDNSWLYSTAPFGYGKGNEQTIVTYGPNPENKYVTTYFRTWFRVDNPGQFSGFTGRLLRDDGAVVYLNGSEIHRTNLHDDDIDYSDYALSDLNAPEETSLDVFTITAPLLVPGLNLLAVEVHQATPSSTDLSFDFQLSGILTSNSMLVTRGPYLQVATSSNIMVRWRTSIPTDSRVRFGTNLADLATSVTDLAQTTEHQITLPGLRPATRYFYDVGTATQKLAGDSTFFFFSAPVPGAVQPIRIWALGDFGTGFPVQTAVRDSYANFASSRYTHVWLMLGDNAYQSGFDYEYQSYVFDVYPSIFRQTVTWPTVGNHDTAQSSALSDAFAYYNIFSFPTRGEAGGVPSGSKHYYSYDYGNVHFICLDSMATILRQPNSAMCDWLRADLADTARDWIIVYFHHPAYSRGTHNSDFEGESPQMRQVVVPILEAGGVDLVLWGHSHVYERSFLIDGFYGTSSTVNPTNFIDHGNGRTNGTGAYVRPAGGMGVRRGTVYVTDGSGGYTGAGSLDHPAMYYSTLEAGSLVIDITGPRLDGRFVRQDGAQPDYFTIDKSDYTNSVPPLNIARSQKDAVMSWPTSRPDYILEASSAVNQTNKWSSSGLITVTNGRSKAVTVPATRENEFFRLRRMP